MRIHLLDWLALVLTETKGLQQWGKTFTVAWSEQTKVSFIESQLSRVNTVSIPQRSAIMALPSLRDRHDTGIDEINFAYRRIFLGYWRRGNIAVCSSN